MNTSCSNKTVEQNFGSEVRNSADLIRSYLNEQEDIPQHLFEPNNVYGCIIVIRILGPFFCLLAIASAVWLNFSPWFCLFLVPFVGIYAYKISFIIHDCCHLSLFSSKKINFFFKNFCGALVATDFHDYRISHYFHHYKIFQKGDPTNLDLPKKVNIDRYSYLKYLISPLFLFRVFRFLDIYLFQRQISKIKKINLATLLRAALSGWVQFLSHKFV